MRMKMMVGALAVAVFLCGSTVARAGFITGELWQAGTHTGASQTAIDNAAQSATLSNVSVANLGTADATFNSGAFNYDSTVTGYTPALFLNNPTFTNTSANFNPNATLDNTVFLFTGTIHLNAGNNSFVVGHDDGLQLKIDGIGLVVDAPGPTSFSNTPFNVNGGASGGDFTFELSYSETNGPPAQLLWTVNGVTITSTPEPASLTMLGIGAVSLLGYAWRRHKKVVPVSAA